MFQGSFKGVSRKFQWCFKEVSRVFLRSFNEVSRVFQGSFKKVSCTFQEVSMKFLVFKNISMVFKVRLMSVLREI